MNASPPIPRRLPMFGHLLQYARDPLGQPTKWALEYGDVVKLQIGGQDIYQLNHPDLIAELLVEKHKSFVKDSYTRRLTELLGNGLVTSEGDFWKRQRRLVNPGFHMSRIRAYGTVMVDMTESHIDTWGIGVERNMHDEMMRLTLGIVAATLFGTDVAEEDAETIGRSLDFFMNHYMGIANTGLRFPQWVPTHGNRRCKKEIAKLDDVLKRYIAKRRGTGDTGDLLSMLIAATDDDGNGMDEQQLRDECVTMIAAGHETTAVALTMAFYLLAQNPRAEERLHRELDEVLGDRAPTLEDLPRLTYTDQVITESLRLLPPVWGIGREAKEDTSLGGYAIRTGDQVFCTQWTTHRDARFFPDPLAFRPERWTDDFKKQLPKYAYFPFGGGQRICIGKRFALMEAVLLLATISRRYSARLVAGQTLDLLPSVTIRPKHGLKMIIQARRTS